MPYPEQFGLPCWGKKQAEKCVNIVAQVAPEQAPLFLATHSPIKNIKDAKADKLITEEDAFQSVFALEREIRGVVRGDVGTGKSHLIRWLNLRADYAAANKEFGLNQFKIVMVQRETGSLKSALKQIVEQLGGEFAQYIEDIKSSIDRFSDKTAREELIQELALEINEKWEQRGHAPLPKDLKVLGDVLLSPGYRRWLRRDGGLVDKIIARWTESSTREDREKNIIFTVAELIPDLGYLNDNIDAPQVHDFVGDLEWDDYTAEDTVKVLNQALIDAQRELSGIKGTKLSEIFAAIRRRLFEQGKQLAIFIEDATAASGGLDLDLFQAFEQKKGKNLCRMIALLGMSNAGWLDLPDNEKDRVDFEFDIEENANRWANDHRAVVEFAARYLNAIRCDNQEINDFAQDRFESDVPRSKCDECPYRDTCHETFGYAQMGGKVKIGLFPFSETAPQKLLKALNQERHRSSPRGLLDLVMNVALTQSYDNFAQNTFPNFRNFGVQRPALTYWTEVENKYMGGVAWTSGTNRDRAKFLAEFWFNANSADGVSASLQPYLKPLGLPELSEGPPEPPKDCIRCGKPVGEFRSEESRRIFNFSGVCENCQVKTPPPPPPPDDRELKELLVKLEEWSRGGRLTSDSKFRTHLSSLIGKAIRWQDYRGVPIKFASDITRGTKPIRIKDQTSRVATQPYFLDFFRDEETRHLLEALVRYKLEGNGSWLFEGGELHKRRVYHWLRKNQHRVVESLEPTPHSLTEDSVKGAAQLLALAAIFRAHSTLPKKKPQKRLAEIFNMIWDDESRPQPLTSSLNMFVSDIEAKWKSAKELLISEVGVGQGAAAPRDFIDPLPILEALEKFEEKLVIEAPPEEINESFWKKRFSPVAKLRVYANLPQKLIEERKEIQNRLEDLKAFMTDCGFGGKDLKKRLGECVQKLIEVLELQKKNLQYPNANFDSLWLSGRLQNNRDGWGTSVAQAAKVIANPKDIDTLCFDPTSFTEAWRDLTIVTKQYLAVVEKELGDQENPGGAKQGGTKKELLDELKQISEMLDKD